jgi:hypothetical protein
MGTIAFDIEVVGQPWESLDEATHTYLLRRERNEARRKTIPDRLALHLGLGRVIAIGMWHVEEQRGEMLQEGDSHPMRPWAEVPGSQIMRGSESEILEAFWRKVAPDADGNQPRLVSYNGRGFDGPVIMVRSAQLRLSGSRDLVGDPRETKDHCDLMDVMTFFGASRDRFSLDYWCRRFDVQSPKSGIDGSQVGKAYEEGRIDEIGEYCLRDSKATAELFERVQPVLLSED